MCRGQVEKRFGSPDELSEQAVWRSLLLWCIWWTQGALWVLRGSRAISTYVYISCEERKRRIAEQQVNHGLALQLSLFRSKNVSGSNTHTCTHTHTHTHTHTERDLHTCCLATRMLSWSNDGRKVRGMVEREIQIAAVRERESTVTGLLT